MDNNLPKAEAVTSYSQESLKWSIHLLRENPEKLLIIVPIMLISILISYVLFRNIISPIVTLLLFTAALSDYLFPVHYEITPSGAASRTIVGERKIEWSQVKKCYLDEYGVKLSPLSIPTRLEAYRGVYLRFARNREDVICAIRSIRHAQHIPRS